MAKSSSFDDKQLMVKRSDETLVPFNKDYIMKSLMEETKMAAIQGIEPIDKEEATFITEEAIRTLDLLNPPSLSSSLIREIVDLTLMKYQPINKKFGVYRNIMQRVGAPFSDVWNILWSGESAFERNENANQQQGNPEVIHKKVADMVIKATVPIAIPDRINKANAMGDIHLHQLEYPNRPFCSDYDLRYFMLNGLLCDGTGLYTAAAGPSKHPEVTILHAVKVMAAGQCACQGGQGLFNFNIFMAPLLKGLDYDTISHIAQMFLFETNETYVSRGGQLVFSSIPLELTIPKIWKEAPIVMNGKIDTGDCYGNYENEAQLFARALLEKYQEGDKLKKMFFFPKPEIRIREETFTDPIAKDLLLEACKLSAKFGTPYFDNLIPSYRDSEGQDCYQCCAYHFKQEEGLLPKVNYEDGQHFSMGGQQVVTINLPRLAYRAKGDDSKVFEYLRDNMLLAKEFLDMKRRWMLDYAKGDHLPFLTQTPMSNHTLPALIDLDTYSSVFGFVGANEMVQHHVGHELHEDKEALKFAIRVLVEMENIKNEFAKETEDGNIYAIARTPAESTSERFALLDMIHYKNEAREIVKGDSTDWENKYKARGRTGVPIYYTNGFMVNHGAEIPLHEKIAIEEKAFPILSGGNILNVFLGEHVPDAEALLNVTQKIAHTLVGYWSYTADLSMCKKCFTTTPGILTHCLICPSTDMEIYSRITGYYQAVSSWNEGKKEELKNRYRFKIEEINLDKNL